MWNPELCCTWGIFSSGKEEIYDLVSCAFANVFYSITIIFPSMPIFDTLDCCMVFIPEMHPLHRIFLCFVLLFSVMEKGLLYSYVSTMLYWAEDNIDGGKLNITMFELIGCWSFEPNLFSVELFPPICYIWTFLHGSSVASLFLIESHLHFHNFHVVET